MSRKELRERLRQRPFILDGAMGTQIIVRGLKPSKCNDYLNIESPTDVRQIHRSYLEAGSDGIITNTFGANKYALGRHALSGQVHGINKAGAEIAREAAGEDGYVLGDIGPTGDFLEPVGSLKAVELKEAFAEQAGALLEGGVDGFIVETMAAVEEAVIAVEAVKSVCSLPVWVSLVFDRTSKGFRTMMGVDVGQGISQIVSLGVDAVGFNCGKAALADYVELAEEYAGQVEGLGREIALLAEPNAGLPELVEGIPVYKVSPEDFAETGRRLCDLGFGIVGGCCGTGPEHVRALSSALR